MESERSVIKVTYTIFARFTENIDTCITFSMVQNKKYILFVCILHAYRI